MRSPGKPEEGFSRLKISRTCRTSPPKSASPSGTHIYSATPLQICVEMPNTTKSRSSSTSPREPPASEPPGGPAITLRINNDPHSWIDRAKNLRQRPNKSIRFSEGVKTNPSLRFSRASDGRSNRALRFMFRGDYSRMKKSTLIFGVVLLSAFTAAAQDIPKAETFFGYSYVRFNPSTSVIPSSNYNGGNAQAGYNFNKWISAVVDLGAVHKSEIGVARVDSTLFNFVAGPRISMHYSRFRPYIQGLVGGVYS